MNQCPSTGKVCFSEARAKKKATQKRPLSVNGYMAAYKCMFCPFWHITHQKQRL